MQAPTGTNNHHTTMYNFMTPYYARRRFLRGPRRISLWSIVRRYQLAELFGFTGVIMLVWLGTQLDNQRSTVPMPVPMGVESASADLIIGVPVGKHRPL